MPPRLSVIILNWQRPDNTLHALELAAASHYSPLNLLVVDNGADPHLARQIAHHFPAVTLLSTGRNLGYAGGNNVGIHHALVQGADYVLLLNDDVFVTPDAFSHLVAAVHIDKQIAAVGPKVLVDENPNMLWAAGPAFPRQQALPPDNGRFDQPTDCEYVVGCCILLKRAALECVGLLDPAFFAIHEEWEWCYRARQAGYRIRYEPAAVVRHHLDRSLTAGHSPLYHYLYLRNLLRFQQRYGQAAAWPHPLKNGLQLWYCEVQFIRSRGSKKWQRIWGASWGLLDFLRGRYGPPPPPLQGSAR